jgi:hypothetical protein
MNYSLALTCIFTIHMYIYSLKQMPNKNNRCILSRSTSFIEIQHYRETLEWGGEDSMDNTPNPGT